MSAEAGTGVSVQPQREPETVFASGSHGHGSEIHVQFAALSSGIWQAEPPHGIPAFCA